jgi:3-methyl-2-oxobutanoate hydroxymethyltransferase
MMIAHGAAVVRGSYHSLVLVDMPFGSYEASPAHAFASASRVMAETGCAAVKLEGGQAMAETIAFLTQRGIPVMAHVGLTPQAVNALGGYGARGKSQEEHAKIMDDARAVAAAGAFAVVLEGVMEDLAIAITDSLDIPVIGIGASAHCDGQVLVAEDMLGMFERTARFVKRYENIAETISGAAERYAAEVRNRSFPGADQVYRPKK